MPLEPLKVDDLDRQIITRLQADGRETNRSLASALEVSEATIAARLRRLDDEDALHVVAVTDMAGFGLPHLGLLMVTTTGRAAVDVATDLAALPEIISVNVVSGRCTLICTVLTGDLETLGRIAGITVPLVAGVASVRCELAIDVLRYASQWAALRTAEPPPVTLRPTADGANADDLDLQIIEVLQHDARQSNRSVATALSISEGTVRTRLKRLEEAGLVRIRAVSDVAASDIGSVAFVGVRAAAGCLDELAEAVMGLDEAGAVLRTLGSYDFILVLVAGDRNDLLTTTIDGLQRLPAVTTCEVFELVATVKHDYRWVRLVS